MQRSIDVCIAFTVYAAALIRCIVLNQTAVQIHLVREGIDSAARRLAPSARPIARNRAAVHFKGRTVFFRR